jgi:hypothetical protein
MLSEDACLVDPCPRGKKEGYQRKLAIEEKRGKNLDLVHEREKPAGGA